MNKTTMEEDCSNQIIDSLERELAQAKALLANQKELIMHLYKQLDEAKKEK